MHDPLDLVAPTNHRVELAIPGELGQVSAELIKDRRAARGGTARLTARAAGVPGWRRSFLALDAREQLDDGLADLWQIGAELLEHLGGNSLTLADQAEEDVLGADVVVPELQRFAQR